MSKINARAVEADEARYQSVSGRRQLRVAVVTSFPVDPNDPCGGVEAVSVHLVRALAKFEDLELHVVTMDPAFEAVTLSKWEKVTIHRLPQLTRRTLANAVGPGRRQITAYIKRLAPDVVHAHDVYGLMTRKLAVPRVFTIHGFIHDDTAVSGGRFAWLRSQVWRQVETRGWADQAHIVSISPYVRERVKTFATGVIHDIDNPISDAFFKIERHDRRPAVFSAAAICARKNTLGLVAGFSRLLSSGVNAELRLSGGTPEKGYAERVRRFIRDHDMQDNVSLLGRIDYQEIFDELASASIFALVSYEENSPMGIEEAMAAGLPVVTSNRCGMPYLVRHGESGYLVNPDDPDDVARRLGEILANDELRDRLGRKGREIAEDRFHPDRVAHRTRELYHEVAGFHGAEHGYGQQ